MNPFSRLVNRLWPEVLDRETELVKARQPTAQDIPSRWSEAFLGPGRPITPFSLTPTHRQDLAEHEPRTFQYIPNVNTTLVPRIAYGLMPFYQLKTYAEQVPEVSTCIRIITEEMKSFEPRIIDGSGRPVLDDEKLLWLAERPDRVHSWPVWLSRFLYNVLVYDAPAVYFVQGQPGSRLPGGDLPIQALRIIDGSTLFVLIDERGEQPAPPAPAFTQVIYGVPKTFIAADQLWYRPRHLRADSPYGRTATEDALTAVELLAELWDNRKKWYQEGTIPEVIATAPEGWGPDKVDQFEEAFNLRMAGANTERAGRLRALPYGFKIDQMKDVTWPKDTYEAAFRTVGRSFGIPGSELGLQGGDATSGRAFLDAMQRTWYRQGLAPLKRYIEGMFNDVLSLNGLEDYSFLLDFPQASIDPEKQTKAIIDKFTNGLLSFNEARQQSGDQGVKGGDVWCIIKGGEPVIMNEIFNRTQGQAVAEGSDAGQPLMNVPLIEQPPAQTSAPAPNVIAPDVKKPSGGPNPFASKSKASSFPFKTKTSEDQTSGSTDTSKVLQPELVKYTGVDLEDDLYYRAPLERVARVDFPVQGANETEIIVAAPNGRPTCPVIWKPSHGEEAALQAVIGGEMGPRDEACYLLDRMLGWYLVPVSWMSNLQGERGLAMLYVRGHEMPQPTLKYAPEWQEKAAAFDYLTGQIDRGREATTNSNWLTHPTDLTRPILIDNGYSLPHALLPVDSWFAASFRAGPNRFSDKVMADLRKLMDILPTWPQIKLVLPPDPILQLSVRLEALLLKGGVPDDVTLE